MASGANEPPRASVAEVSATVRAPNSRERSTRPTSSGATRSVGGRRVSSGERSSHTTSPRSATCSPNASRIRLAVPRSSSSEASVIRAVAIRCGSSSSDAALARTASAHAPAASCTDVSVAASVSDSSSIRPGGASPRSMASAAAAWRNCSAPAAGAPSAAADSVSRPARRAATSTAGPESSPVVAEVTRSTRSCASSMMTTSCSGSTSMSDVASMASRAWLVTTMSARAAASLACSAKQREPNGQRCAPMHSCALTETWRQAASGTPGTSSSRSPVVVVSAHSCSRLTCRPSGEAGPPAESDGVAGSNRASCGSSRLRRRAGGAGTGSCACP